MRQVYFAVMWSTRQGIPLREVCGRREHRQLYRHRFTRLWPRSLVRGRRGQRNLGRNHDATALPHRRRSRLDQREANKADPIPLQGSSKPTSVSPESEDCPSPTHRIARSTIAKTLKEHGIRPAPERPTTWRTFLRTHRDVIVGADFFTTEVWTARCRTTFYTLFVVDIATRAIHIAGTTTNPDADFMAQVARNLTDGQDGFLLHKLYLILDADTKFTDEFKAILKDSGIKTVRICYQARI